MIIGITGLNGAGKTTVVEYLEKKSFLAHSLSDVLRDILRKEGKPLTRENLIEKGNQLREKQGDGILGEVILQKLQDNGVHYVIDSIRHPDEVEALRRREDFILVCVDAPTEVRFERMLERKRENETNYVDILAFEKEELESEEHHKQQLSATAKMAQIVLVNNKDIEELYAKIDKMLADLYKRYGAIRPSWDMYFMSIAKAVATRSNCMKRKVASLIVKDKRIISTGYNGTPRGATNCNEGGCPRCNAFAEGGTQLAECLCSHGEENAIVQAAYHGISIKDSILYTTFSPCLICAKMIINAGIRAVVYNAEYPLSDVSFSLLKEAGITLQQQTL